MSARQFFHVLSRQELKIHFSEQSETFSEVSLLEFHHLLTMIRFLQTHSLIKTLTRQLTEPNPLQRIHVRSAEAPGFKTSEPVQIAGCNY